MTSASRGTPGHSRGLSKHSRTRRPSRGAATSASRYASSRVQAKAASTTTTQSTRRFHAAPHRQKLHPDAMCNISLQSTIEPPGLHGVTHGLRFRFRFRSATSLVPNRTSRRLIHTCSSGPSGSTHLVVHMLPDPYLDRTLRRSVKPRIVEYLMSCVLVVFRRSCPVTACVATVRTVGQKK